MARTAIPIARDIGLAKMEREDFGGAPELFSGDTPLPVSSYTNPVAQNSNLRGYSVVGWAGNAPGAALVMANFMGELLGGDGSGLVASGVGTFAGVGLAGETITIDGVVYTLRAAPALANEVKIGATAAASAQNLADAINADPDAILAGTIGPDTEPHPTVSATVAGAVVTVRANNPGTAGNALATTETSATLFSWGAATLAGGTDEAAGGIRPIGITTVDAITGAGVTAKVALFTSGCFNPDALIWDDSFNTDEKKKHAFVGSPLGVIIILKPKYQPWDTGN